MRPYLESTVLQSLVASFFDARDEHEQPARCGGMPWCVAGGAGALGADRALGAARTSDHGPDLAAGKIRLGLDPLVGALLGPPTTELMPKGRANHQAIGASRLRSNGPWRPMAILRMCPVRGPLSLAQDGWPVRDTDHDDRAAWVVRDGRYLSARWPGDVHTWASRSACWPSQTLEALA